YTDHPKGAAVVKEMFSKKTGKLEGWSVAVKTDKDSNQGKGWFWVEFTSTKDSSKVGAPPGNGAALCSGCHQTGRDFVLSQLPK
ncbi:MAG: cytochrome P460 family protein, partial [Methyloligellaceae bacterium]